MVSDDNKPTIPFGSSRFAQKKTLSWVDLILVLLIASLALLLRLWNISAPENYCFDEVYYVPAAQALWEGKMDPNSVHPPLGKWFIGAGMEVGRLLPGQELSESTTWRLSSVFAGVLMVIATYGFCWTLFPGYRVAAGAAAFLVATEHLHLTMTRIAMLEASLALLCLLGTWGIVAYLLGHHERWAVAGAFCLGLATGCKWSGVLTAFGCLLACAWYERLERPMERTQRVFFWLLLLVPSGFLLSYFHQFLADGAPLETLKTIWTQAQAMIRFRYDDEQFTHGYKSAFSSWPLVLRPIWLFYEQDGTGPGATVWGICSLGVPLLWWGFLVLALERTYAAVKSGDHVSGILIALWLGQWLPWAASTTGGFFYYMLPQVPIMACMVGKFWADLANFEDSLGEGRWKAWLLLGLYILTFVLYFPYAVGLESSRRVFEVLFFLPGWV